MRLYRAEIFRHCYTKLLIDMRCESGKGRFQRLWTLVFTTQLIECRTGGIHATAIETTECAISIQTDISDRIDSPISGAAVRAEAEINHGAPAGGEAERQRARPYGEERTFHVILPLLPWLPAEALAITGKSQAQTTPAP